MSSRRKRAPPIRLSDEEKKLHCWNMHEDRRLEDFTLEEENPGTSTSFSFHDVKHAKLEQKQITESLSEPLNLPLQNDTDITPTLVPLSVHLSMLISPVPTEENWKALLGVFSLHLSSGQSAHSILQRQSFTLTKDKPWSSQLLMRIHDREEEIDEGTSTSFSSSEELLQVETWLCEDLLEDLRWLQKKKLIALYYRSAKSSDIEVGIYLLEACLSKPEFLSQGNGRMKKACILMQRLMETFYNFTIPDVIDDNEEESDRELERQNIEELYDYVRQTHQQEGNLLQQDVQHPALIPVLRPYQNEAVNWMLQKENFMEVPSTENTLHPLWREVSTLEEVKIYYNPFTGCVIRERPVPGHEWPGGILADEMGLGKTVEVLSLILCHPRKDVRKDVLTLPEGKLVNYFIPPPPMKSARNKKEKVADFKSKERIQFPSLRVMILAAIKEISVKKGASIIAIFKYISTIYRYDVQRNRRLLKRTIEKLISEKIVEQVKGHGLAGSFKLGKNYKENKIQDKSQKLKTKSSKRLQHSLSELRDHEKEQPEKVKCIHAAAKDHDYCTQHKESTTDTELKDKGEVKERNVSKLNASLETKHENVYADHPHSQEQVCQTGAVFPFNTADYRFECICGELGLYDYKARVQCLQCHLWQHAECVNYKQENLGVTPFYCPHCLVAMKPVPTGATLIISPSSICHQWVDEINRHVQSSSLHVMVYQGVKKHGFLQPQMLAEQDVVITTYDVLRSELNYVDIPHSNSEDGRKFRNQKRYMAVPSPLVAVEWWRICLDEAQMVECTTAKAAEMALRLSGINRWCVSGTPVQRGLEDLFGLVLFLGVDPYWVKHWWDQLLYKPYCRKDPFPLYKFISKIMWRSAKKDVLDQIQIPPQTEDVHWLHFSPVERHFYHRQHEVCCQDALAKFRKITDWALKLSSLDRRTVSSILYPLLRLRQACCHPQAVRGEFLPLQKSTMTMEELLTSLQKKCRTECEEAHRQLVCALNGLAGIHIIKGEYPEATELYREVLRSSEEHKEKLKTDSLQVLSYTDTYQGQLYFIRAVPEAYYTYYTFCALTVLLHNSSLDISYRPFHYHMAEGNSDGPFSRGASTSAKVKYLACAKCCKRLPSGRKEPLCSACSKPTTEVISKAQDLPPTATPETPLIPIALEAPLPAASSQAEPPQWAIQLYTGIPKLADCLGKLLDRLDHDATHARTSHQKRQNPNLADDFSDIESPHPTADWEHYSLSEGEISSEDDDDAEEPTQHSSEAIDSLISAVISCLNLKTPEAAQESSQPLFKRQRKSLTIFPSHQQLDSIIQSEWDHPEKRFQASRRFQRYYPFPQEFQEKLSNPPSVDAPVSRLSKNTALPVPDSSSFKDPMDKKMEGFLRSIFTTAGESLRPVLAAAWVSRATQSWTDSLLDSINSGTPRHELAALATQIKSASEYLGEASLDAVQAISRTSALSVAARRSLWLKMWSADLSSKKSLTVLPFKGKLLFGPELDKIISQATGGKSTLLPQSRNRTTFRRGRSFRTKSSRAAPSRDYSSQNSFNRNRFQNRPKPSWQNKRSQPKPADKSSQ
eukprot:XP_017949475.1 PREDICTED: E3 ubiquitin-protein ligase SHPRH [Xenopus tropicalis]